MLFNSFDYLLFFPLVVLGYFILPLKSGWYWLLAAGCVFYMWLIPAYIGILAIAIGIDYAAGIFIEQSKREGERKFWLVTSIVSTCALLFVFKYFNFFSVNIQQLSGFLGWNYAPVLLEWALPVGLSFHTFQSLSYVIEVYKGRQKAEYNLAVYSLYVLFFPQLVAGPIERPQALLYQFHQKHQFDYDRLCQGLLRIAWGLFKKVVIADRAAVLVNFVYENPAQYPGGWVLIATLLFAVQIYCDFSGYSDMAIGSAKVMGFNFSPNFKTPYFSLSVGEFWRRWHISLSSWFRDYIYLPLGGSQGHFLRVCLHIFIVFALSGLWHGAAWPFVVWGVFHAFCLIIERLALRFLAFPAFFAWPIFIPLRWLWTFSLVCIGWVFFRAANMDDAWLILTKIFTQPLQEFGQWTTAFDAHQIENCNSCLTSRPNIYYTYGISAASLYLLVACTFLAFIIEYIHQRFSMPILLQRLPLPLRWLLYYGLLWSIVILGQFEQKVEFIYFQF